jgi:molybdate transport repressor ModE-like protein
MADVACMRASHTIPAMPGTASRGKYDLQFCNPRRAMRCSWPVRDTKSLIDWDDIQLLLAVAGQGTYAKAARQAGVSLATVGRRLRALEQALGVALVERHPEGHRLTLQAQALLPAASRMAVAAADLSARAGQRQAVIRILAREWEGLFLIRHYHALHRNLPHTRIEIGSKHWPDLGRREAEIVLTNERATAGTIVERKLGQMAFAVYGHRGGDISENWIGLTPVHSYFSAEQWLARHCQDKLEDVYQFDNGFLLLEAIRRGVGRGLLPVWLGDHDPLLVRLSDPLPDVIHPILHTINGELRHEPQVRAVTEALVRLFRTERRTLLGETAGVAGR